MSRHGWYLYYIVTVSFQIWHSVFRLYICILCICSFSLRDSAYDPSFDGKQSHVKRELMEAITINNIQHTTYRVMTKYAQPNQTRNRSKLLSCDRKINARNEYFNTRTSFQNKKVLCDNISWSTILNWKVYYTICTVISGSS